MDHQLTPWFKGSDRPVRIGLYQVQGSAVPFFWSYWDGSRWGMISHTPEGAVGWRGKPSGNQYRRWRGVLK